MAERVDTRRYRSPLPPPEVLEAKGIIVDVERIKLVVGMALKAREDQAYLFRDGVSAPEEKFIAWVKQEGESRGDPRFALNAVFFLVPAIFADGTIRQFRRINRNSEEGNLWLFDPREIVLKTQTEVAEAAEQFIGAGGYNRRAFVKWYHNASVLVGRYGGDIANFFAVYGNSAPAILNELEGPIKKGKDWMGFHRFGPKLGRLFLQWVDQYELYPLEEMDQVGVPVDFQVARLLLQTEAVKSKGAPTYAFLVEKVLNYILPEVFLRMKVNPRVVSETFWNIGNRCCNNYDHAECPISKMCTMMISRHPFDEGGRFVLRDIGRYHDKKTARMRIRLRKEGLDQPDLPLEFS